VTLFSALFEHLTQDYRSLTNTCTANVVQLLSYYGHHPFITLVYLIPRGCTQY